MCYDTLMQNTKNFDNLYAKLNITQREAVDSIDGPVMVVAGPGTGKTQVLSLRIANILRLTDTSPEQILALTFTEAGVSAMRKRLHSIIGITSYRIPIYTFHGFCNEIIARFPEHFPELVGSRATSELDRIILLQKVFDSSNLEHLASYRSPYHYVEKTLKAIAELKREAIDPEGLDKMVEEESRAIKEAPDYVHSKGAHKGKVRGVYKTREEALLKVRELVLLYRAYESAMVSERMYDYEDMILSVVRKLGESEDLRLLLQEEYQYLLTDEYQDGNGAQNKVLELLSSYHDSPNLFIVGDEDQAIYRFQGASHRNFTSFLERFPKAKRITLTENYRSTQAILDTVAPLGGRTLISRSPQKQVPILLVEHKTSADEANAVGKAIREKIDEGTLPHEIALFTRTNKELALYASALARFSVPVSVLTKDDVLDDIHIQKLLTMLSAVSGLGEDEMSLLRALHLDVFLVPEIDIYTFARDCRRSRTSLWQAKGTQGIESARSLLEKLAKKGSNVSPAELISSITRETGLLKQILAHPEAELKLAKLSVLMKYVEDYTRTHRGARLTELTQVLSLLDEYNVLDAKGAGRKEGCVQLSTAHGGKGLEYDNVFIVNATEGNWGGRTNHTAFRIPGLVPSTSEEEEVDERHLFYVAMTRARKELTISYGSGRDDGKPLLPSRFLDMLPDKNVVKKKADEEMTLEERVDSILVAEPQEKTRDEIIAFVRETFLERGLAVTALNNYLKCPWQYFYRNLLRVPEPLNVHLMFGDAMHEAFKAFFDAYAKNEDLSKEEWMARLDRELEHRYFTDKELIEMKKVGKEAVNAYYGEYKGTWNRNLKNEFPIDVSTALHDGTELRLTGKLDRVEFESHSEVVVVDYKTGKPKSRNYIEGKTKGEGSGDYKRQLTFYKLLLSLYDDGKYSMDKGVIEFVMPDKKNKCHREDFVISKEEVDALLSLVKDVASEILTLSFWDKGCHEKDCEYCALRESLK